MSLINKLSKALGLTPHESGELLLRSLPYEEGEVASPEARQVAPVSGLSNMNLTAGLETEADGKAERSTGLDYKQLEGMTHIPLISAIIQTRVNQVAEFSVPRRDGADIGFQIRLKGQGQTPSDEDAQRIEDLYEFMQYCGDPRLASDVGFDGFLRMLVRDSLTYDQACFEVIRNRKGDVAGFQMVDSATIRRAALSEDEKRSGRRDPQGTHFVQVLENKVVAEFGYDDLCFGIRRPRSIMRYRGYGNPELSEAVPLISNLISAEQYNSANFTNGIAGKGIIAVKTKMSPQLFTRFRQSFYAMMNGANNAHKTALIQLDPDFNEDVQNVSFGQSNRDMEFQDWHRWQIKMICAIFQIDPAEIGLKMGSEGVSSTLSENSGRDRVMMSKDKGLRPLLRAIQAWLNEDVVCEIDPRFELVFTGLDKVDALAQLKLDEGRVTSYMTINELRATKDLPPIEGGDIILNPQYIQAQQMGIASKALEIDDLRERITMAYDNEGGGDE